ncbi:MAG: reprolysin-like metallopeptidase [Chloroflexota bacterium]
MPSFASGETGIWQDVSEFYLRDQSDSRLIVPDEYRTVQADTAQLQTQLARAPMEIFGFNQMDGVVLELPLPNGENGRFRIIESPIMEAGLAVKYPDIKTYIGEGIDDPSATARLDWTPHGFHGMILSQQGTIYIDPYSRGNVTHYISYYKRDFTPTQAWNELPPVDLDGTAERVAQLVAQNQGSVSSGSQLRTYRLVVAATGEYTAFHGGTVGDAQAEIVTAINRVTGIFERETAVRLVLISNNDDVIFTNGSTDPYSNNNGFAMLDQNQAELDSTIGSANYDVGHVFSTGGGGIAGLGVICSSSRKGEGVTGLSNPVGDPFYVDFVAHEIGHQFAGTHSFNSTRSSCGGGNRTGSSAYEPGSATTIMGYAGICGSDNIQSNSDDYFHTINFDQIMNHVTFGSGSNCGTVTSTGNNPPIADAGTGGFTIPADTPFELTGSGSDADGTDSLTYNWEQFDLGPSGSPNSPSGNAPLFRSFTATSSPTRTFPQLSDLLNNTQTLGELLPSYTRSLEFRLTVRDNETGGGGVDYDSISFDVDGNSGPFLVTAPNTAVSWTFGGSETVTWDVAGTSSAPVSCANVDILFSFDGGNSFPITLLAGTLNDGSESVTVPNASTSDARLKVACSDNIFFDISDSDFTITSSSPNAPTAVNINGDTTGLPFVNYTFTADTTPTDAVIPITYQWTATDLSGVTQLNLTSDTVTFSWFLPGTKTIHVTASNSAGTISSSTFEIEIDGDVLFLPLIRK